MEAPTMTGWDQVVVVSSSSSSSHVEGWIVVLTMGGYSIVRCND